MTKKFDYCLQHKDYGLGNFTNVYYTLRRWPMPVYFESEYVAEIYSDLERLDERPDWPPTLSSEMINRPGDRPDWAYVMANHLSPHLWPDDRTIVIANGCANPDKRHTKDPGTYFYNRCCSRLKEQGYFIIAIGSEEDRDHTEWWNMADYCIWGDASKCKSVLERCRAVIMNDTGWYHYAGLLGKKGFIYWKETDSIKNQSPNKNFYHHFDWYAASRITFDEWLYELSNNNKQL